MSHNCGTLLDASGRHQQEDKEKLPNEDVNFNIAANRGIHDGWGNAVVMETIEDGKSKPEESSFWTETVRNGLDSVIFEFLKAEPYEYCYLLG